MKCNVCGQEFGNGAYCQHCKADRITALGNYSGGYNAPDAPKDVPSNASTGGSNPTSGYGFNDTKAPNSYNSSKRSGAGSSGEQFMVCYNCANVIPVDSEYCPCCRIKLYEVCPKCGHRYSSQYKICNKCGTDREEYLAEQRLLEQRRQEEARRKEAEHQKVLEEERRRERLRIEEERRRAEERQRQLEAKRREEERQKEEAQKREAELIRRIKSSDAYKETSDFINDMHSCVSEKLERRINRRIILSSIFRYIGLICLLTGFAIYIIGAIISDDWTDTVRIGGFLMIGGIVALLVSQSFGGSRLSDDNARAILEQTITRRLSESYYNIYKFHNNFARQAAKKYVVYYGHKKERQEGLYDIFRKMVSPNTFNQL